LRQLEKSHGIKVALLPYSPGNIVSRPALLDAVTTQSPRLVVVAEGSNVTGEQAHLPMIADVCRHHGVLLLVDAAQTAGRQPSALADPGISFWAAPAHKGFFGPSGLGLLYVNPSCDLEPIVSGGTGSASEQTTVPSVYPDRLEPGTQPVHAMAGLAAGVRFITETGVEKICQHEMQLCQRFLRWTTANTFVKTFGDSTREQRLPVVSFHLSGLTPDRIADLLDAEYGIAVRAGLHCAAQAHCTLGTTKLGTCRVSFGLFNSVDEVDVLTAALASLSKVVTKL
jgi:selenocysteine lyase/cysteine desulfurase